MRTHITCGGRRAAIGGILIAFGFSFCGTPPAAAQDIAAAPSLTAEGSWSPHVLYRKNDIVTARGSTWRAKRASRNKVPGQTDPSTADYWEVLAAGFRPRGAWSASRAYQPNDLVIYLGTTWRARLTNTNVTPAPGVTWRKFAVRGARGTVGPQGPQGPQGPAGPNSVPAGTQTAPAITFSGDADTGVYSPGAGKVALVENGALFMHNLGTSNTALGSNALRDTTGNSNTAVGDSALSATGMISSSNTAVGFHALSANLGSNNTAVGADAIGGGLGGRWGTAVGAGALFQNSGDFNTALGLSALGQNTTGAFNVAVGAFALNMVTTGENDIALGVSAGSSANNVSNAIFIGNDGTGAGNGTIRIGTGGTHSSAFVAGIWGTTTGNPDAIPVLIDSNGQFGTVNSSRRYKDDIETMPDMTAMLGKLRPVTFRYKKPYADGSRPLQYGLIAEEVADIFPALAVFNKDGAPETVKYHLLPTFLLAGWQAQQKTIAAQADKLRQQKAINASLEARLSRLEALLPRTRAALQ